MKKVAPKCRTSGRNPAAVNFGVRHTVAPLASAGAHSAMIALPWNSGMQQ